LETAVKPEFTSATSMNSTLLEIWRTVCGAFVRAMYSRPSPKCKGNICTF